MTWLCHQIQHWTFKKKIWRKLQWYYHLPWWKWCCSHLAFVSPSVAGARPPGSLQPYWKSGSFLPLARALPWARELRSSSKAFLYLFGWFPHFFGQAIELQTRTTSSKSSRWSSDQPRIQHVINAPRLTRRGSLPAPIMGHVAWVSVWGAKEKKWEGRLLCHVSRYLFAKVLVKQFSLWLKTIANANINLRMRKIDARVQAKSFKGRRTIHLMWRRGEGLDCSRCHPPQLMVAH